MICPGAQLYSAQREQRKDPATSTHLPLVLQATAHPLKVRAPPVAPMSTAALPAVPLWLLQGPAASPGVIQEVPHGVGLQHPFLQAEAGLAGSQESGSWPCPGARSTDPLVALILRDLLHLLIHLLNVLSPPLLPLLGVQRQTPRIRKNCVSCTEKCGTAPWLLSGHMQVAGAPGWHLGITLSVFPVNC